jgi:hypothetical protein
MDTNQNAESLHEVGKGKASPTAPAFVNAGTPAAPLVTMETSKTNPEVSKEASSALQANLVSGK